MNFRRALLRVVPPALALLLSVTFAAPGTEALRPVTAGKDTLFFLRASGELTAAERAEITTRRVAAYLALPDGEDALRVDSIAPGVRELRHGDALVVRIHPEDVPEGGSADSLAAAWRDALLAASETSHRDRNLWRILLHVAGVAGIVLLVAGVEVLVFRLAGRAKTRITQLAKERKLPAIRIQRVTLLSQERSQEILLVVFRTMVTAVHLVIAYAALLLLFSVFPWTREWAYTLFVWSLGPFRAAGLGFVEFLPDLFHILVVVLLAHLFLRLLRRLAVEVEAGNLRLPGFYADWGRPTFNIIRFITYAFALVLIFPKLPGSESAAFRGVSVFLGLLVSLGSSAAFSNIVAGVVMTYMRSFHVGDLIQAGTTRGVVTERTMLVTRVRTFHGELVTLPNAALLAGNTTNFTTMARSGGIAVHTRVSVGYDVPWRKVHGLLLEAARRTPDLLQEPEPFVLQSELRDSGVAYELNAYTRDAVRMPHTYSALHQNVQDVFAEAGVEMTTLHYRAVRDGGASTVPPRDAAQGHPPPAGDGGA